jgi:hypothetical protein
MAASVKQMKMIVPVNGEYATLVHPSTPSTIPTAKTAKVIALLAFPVISSPPSGSSSYFNSDTNKYSYNPQMFP